MDNQFLYIVAAMVTGALIAGGTNVLAIVMLFRPHKPLYIGKHRIPFTPGLIPGKQKQLAEKIASIVADHILTPEAIKHSLQEKAMEHKIEAMLLTYWERCASSCTTLATYLDHTGLQRQPIESLITNKIITQINNINRIEIINLQLSKLVTSLKHQKINQLLPESAMSAVDNGIHLFVTDLLEHLNQVLQEERTAAMLVAMLDETFAIKNSLVRKLFLNIIADGNVQQQIMQKLQKFLTSETIALYFENYLLKQWSKIHGTSIGELQTRYPEQSNYMYNQLADMIYTALHNNFQSEAFRAVIAKEVETLVGYIWTMPLSELFQLLMPYKDAILTQLKQQILSLLETHSEQIIDSFNLRGIVEQQVASFPSTRLEEIILQIAKKELQYITLIGALIGALLGIVQFLLAYSTL